MRNDPDESKCRPEDYGKAPSANQKDLEVQLILSLLLGLTALLVFCILRPRWPSLYSARKRRLDPAVGLPALPRSFLGWIPALYRVTEDQILASAGLDAFVFLAFFKMAISLFMIMAFFAIVVLVPINAHYRDFPALPGYDTNLQNRIVLSLPSNGTLTDAFRKDTKDRSGERTYLWAYVFFTYFFAGLTVLYLTQQTSRVIRARQNYLGSQSTITDRTFRLTGIPPELRSEAKLKALIEKLDIRLVESVTMCRQWSELDKLMTKRDRLLRRLEAAWAQYLKRRRSAPKQRSHWTQTCNANAPAAEDDDVTHDAEQGENARLLESELDRPHILEGDRPQVSIRHGPLKLRRRKVDAIDYYDEYLRRLDEKIVEARAKHYTATDMALVTMDSVASCQMVIQARIDPSPGQLLTKTTPSPSDLVWRNTYAWRGVRRLKSWTATLFITFLTLVWIFPTAILASWLSICTIKRVMPAFYVWLEAHPLVQTLFQNGLPTLVVSLLNVAVPYLYDWLSNQQGMISQGDVELSVISKNFFFTFFNTFFVFAVSRTGFDFWSVLQDFLKDTSKIPAAIAADVEDLSIFYISFIMLQGIGLMPFRILEAGSVALFPFYRIMSSTPRDRAELEKPPVFQYGFYLPTALLVFNLCLIYSVLMWGFAILVVGTVYFALGYFTFKYMVLYAMDQPQHATGGAWRIICYRIIIGLVVFEVVMVGQTASLAAFVQSVTIFPLIPITIWYSFFFKRRFEPLTRYIALSAIKTEDDEDGNSEEAVEEAPSNAVSPQHHSRTALRRGSTLDEFKEQGLVFVNPSLVVPLQQPWIYEEQPPSIPTAYSGAESGRRSHESTTILLPNADRSLGIGDQNVWVDGGGGHGQ